MATQSTQSRMGAKGGKRRLGSRPKKASTGAAKVKTVAKVRRTKVEVYGTPDQWRKTCADVKKYYNNRCAICGSTDRLEVHHVVPASRGGQTAKLFLKLLCHACHSRQPGHTHMKR